MLTPEPRATVAPPRRRGFVIAASVATLLAVYGSLVPFHYRALDWAEAVARLRNLPLLDLDAAQRADWVANILLFIPLAFLWCGALALDRRSVAGRWIAAASVMAAGVATSIALEFVQLWFPVRTVSANDVIAESIGAVAGALLWVAGGQAIVEWIRGYTRQSQRRRQIEWLLEAYVVGLALYSVLPLDLTISSGDFAAKLRAGRINLLPFADADASWSGLYDLVRDIVVFAPVGMLVAVWRVHDGRVRAIWLATLLSSIVALGFEIAQLPVLSRFTSSTDWLMGTAGAAVGATVAHAWYGAVGRRAPPTPHSAKMGPFLRWAAAALAYAVIVVVILCAPFRVSGTGAEWRARYEGFWAVPFARLYRGSEFNAVSDSLRKVLLFGILGALVTMSIRALKAPPRVRLLLLAGSLALATGLAAAIELLQVVLPPHVPDVTDVLLGALGSAVGIAVTWRVVAKDRPF